MKRQNEILTLSTQRQRLLDEFLQVVEKFLLNTQQFDAATKTTITTEVTDSINNFLAIEYEMFSALPGYVAADAYAPPGYIVNENDLPTFQSLQEIQTHYTALLAKLIEEMTPEAAETKYIVTDAGSENTTATKSATWQTAESDIVTSLGVMNTTMMADDPSVVV
jgi:hypothetical protein